MSRRTSFVVLAVLAAGCGEAAPAKPSPSAPPPATAPVIPIKKTADWCKQHGVPESACTRCNSDLVAEFQKKGDWCEKHGLPLSQCVACDPSVAAKLAAMAPKDAEK